MARAPLLVLLLVCYVSHTLCYLLSSTPRILLTFTPSSRINTLSSLRPRVQALPVRRDRASGLLKMAITEEEVEKFLRVVEEGKEAKASTKLFKALKKASGAVSVAIEFSRHPNADDGALHGVEFRQFSLKMRREKAGAIFVNADSKSGLQDCEKFVEEQVSAGRSTMHVLTCVAVVSQGKFSWSSPCRPRWRCHIAASGVSKLMSMLVLSCLRAGG